jgi:hypothetical protein
LSFPEKWGAPGEVKLERLISWTEHENPGVKYFSGTASYTTNIQLSKKMLRGKSSVYLDLGEVLDVAEVLVNGMSAGVLWTKPFKLDIRKYLRPGENQLDIKVTNMWINRLTGDMNLPDGEKFCKTNQPYVTKDRSPWGDETFRVQRAGLLGPVRISYSV